MGRIMIVEDERDVATLVRILLEREGHTVTEAYNGAEALEKLGVEPPVKDGGELPELIILDVMLPILDGPSVCGRLFRDPRTRAIPLVVLTGKTGAQDLFKQYDSVFATIEKPFDPKKLRDVVRGALAH